MSTSLIIRKSLAALLMLVFAFGITPKRTLHNIIATHKDEKAVKHDHPGTCIGKAVFNCQCDSLVAESAFVDDVPVSEIAITGHFSNYNEAAICRSFTTDLFSYSLRGPPAC